MQKAQTVLQNQREALEQAKAVLRVSRDEVTGLALSKLLKTLSEQSLNRLMTATDIGEVRSLQGEIRAYQKLLDAQQDKINPTI